MNNENTVNVRPSVAVLVMAEETHVSGIVEVSDDMIVLGLIDVPDFAFSAETMRETFSQDAATDGVWASICASINAPASYSLLRCEQP